MNLKRGCSNLLKTEHSHPFFTILINNYNYDKFLEEAIQSAIKQDFESFEVIVVDDCSTDNSHKILKKYKNNITLYSTGENQGQCAAFNIGIQNARGAYICMLDADDVFYPYKLTELYNFIQEYPHKDLYYHPIIVTNPDLTKHYYQFPTFVKRGKIQKQILKSGDFFSHPPTSALCFRKDFIKDFIPLDVPLCHVAGDAPLVLLTALLSEVAGIKKPLSLYRLHGKNAYTNYNFLYGEPQTILKSMIEKEKVYFFINRTLKRLGYPIHFDIHKSFSYIRFKYILRKTSFKNFLWTYLKEPISKKKNFRLITETMRARKRNKTHCV